MNADRVARTCAKRACKGKSVNGSPYLGTVLINLQQTCLDHISAIRIWAKIDDAMKILADKLGLDVADEPLPAQPKEVFFVPYNERGEYDPLVSMKLDLRVGKKVRVAPKDALNFNTEGVVTRRDNEGNFLLNLEHVRLLGRWWPLEAEAGTLDYLPVVNVKPKIKAVAQES